MPSRCSTGSVRRVLELELGRDDIPKRIFGVTPLDAETVNHELPDWSSAFVGDEVDGFSVLA